MNNIIIFIILGIVQGFTEPLPISSSGHLVIFQELLNVEIPGLSFEAFINFGSTIAIVIFFRKDLIKLIVGFFGFIQSGGQKFKTEMDFIIKIIIATIPLVLFGLLLVITGIEIGDSVRQVGFALAITGVLLFIVSRSNGSISTNDMTYKQALFIGIFQAIALIPGLSRSGMTLVAALIVGIKSKDAFNFSFIMFIPASVGALLFSFIEIAQDPNLATYATGYMVSFVLAGIFTWLGLIVTKRFVMAQKLHYFAVYVLVLSAVILFTT